jgi:thiamine biosynthesis protein ThiS
MRDAGARVRVVINGEPRELAAGATIASLIRESGRDPRTVAVELNGEVLGRSRYESTVLAADDRIEVVHFVQGG